MDVSCLLLAAGQSSRMLGRNKLLLEVEGEALVRRTLREIQKADLAEVIVVTGHESERVSAKLRDLSPRIVYNGQHSSGMHSSIREGLLSLRKPCDGFLICLSDQPYFEQRAIDHLLKEFEGEAEHILVPTFDGKRGHPVLIPSRFIGEILEEPDRDSGCSYLLKRHPEKVREIPFDGPGILLDIDEPKDYEAMLSKAVKVRDPFEDFLTKSLELRHAGKPFALAQVIEVIGSASARLGSRAIFDEDGRNIFGWIGGGCAERFVGEEAQAAMRAGEGRTVLADLDDEVFGLGVACGGKMKVFIEPVLPPELIALPWVPEFAAIMQTLAGFYGWHIRWDEGLPKPATLSSLVLTMAQAVARKRGLSGFSLRDQGNAPARFRSEVKIQSRAIVLVGRSRITEALARHFTLLSYSVRVVGPELNEDHYPKVSNCRCSDENYEAVTFTKGEIVVIASHSALDPVLVGKALGAEVSYVAMVGSLKRAREVLSYLKCGEEEVSCPLFLPAGLDIGAKNPEEIALSITSEVLSLSDDK